MFRKVLELYLAWIYWNRTKYSNFSINLNNRVARTSSTYSNNRTTWASFKKKIFFSTGISNISSSWTTVLSRSCSDKRGQPCEVMHFLIPQNNCGLSGDPDPDQRKRPIYFLYEPYALLMNDSRTNQEICSSIESMEHLFPFTRAKTIYTFNELLRTIATKLVYEPTNRISSGKNIMRT